MIITSDYTVEVIDPETKDLSTLHIFQMERSPRYIVIVNELRVIEALHCIFDNQLLHAVKIIKTSATVIEIPRLGISSLPVTVLLQYAIRSLRKECFDLGIKESKEVVDYLKFGHLKEEKTEDNIQDTISDDAFLY